MVAFYHGYHVYIDGYASHGKTVFVNSATMLALVTLRSLDTIVTLVTTVSLVTLRSLDTIVTLVTTVSLVTLFACVKFTFVTSFISGTMITLLSLVIMVAFLPWLSWRMSYGTQLPSSGEAPYGLG
jgi:hypothetical protein